MSKSVLVVTGSIRPNSVNQHVVPLVVEAVKKSGNSSVIADLGKLALPFIDTPAHPLSPDFNPEYDNVKEWTKMVADADAVVFVMPEYNHTMTPIQINAVDWIGKEWQDKPVAFVSYGMGSGGSQAQDTARTSFTLLKAKIAEEDAKFMLGKDISPTGEVLNEEFVKESIAKVIDSVTKL